MKGFVMDCSVFSCNISTCHFSLAAQRICTVCDNKGRSYATLWLNIWIGFVYWHMWKWVCVILTTGVLAVRFQAFSNRLSSTVLQTNMCHVSILTDHDSRHSQEQRSDEGRGAHRQTQLQVGRRGLGRHEGHHYKTRGNNSVPQSLTSPEEY